MSIYISCQELCYNVAFLQQKKKIGPKPYQLLGYKVANPGTLFFRQLGRTRCRSLLKRQLELASTEMLFLHLWFLLLRPGYPNPTGSAFPSCPLRYSLPCRNHGRPIRKTLMFC